MGSAGWCGVRTLAAQELTQHYGRKPADEGPRAVGLVQLSSTGKARLIPIVIMMNGKFYDAASFKATPVPMALDFGVVYEAFKTGVSQGIFTITQPGQLNHNWIAEGTWLPAGVKTPETKKKYAAPVIEDDDSKSDRPVLHRRAAGKADQDEEKPANSASTQPASPPSGGTAAPTTSPGASSGSAGSSEGSSPTGSTGSSSPTTSAPTSSTGPASTSSPPSSSSPAPTSSPSSSSGSATNTPGTESKNTGDANKQGTSTAAKTSADAKSSASARTSADDEPINDPNRPRLRRGKPDPNAHHELFVDFDAEDEAAKKSGVSAAGALTGAASAAKPSNDVPPPVLTVAAISDAKGPDPRPYTYDLKPAEEAIYRKKMLDLAATLVKPGPGSSAVGPSSAGQNSAAGAAAGTKASSASSKSVSTQSTKAASTKSTKADKAQFDDVNLRIFDLSNSNEPVLVLSARTPLPQVGASGALPQEITLVARTDLEGEVQKLFFAQTDSRHLDVSPRMELIDAVDADGDGRGELLFRRTSDAGSSYAIYRVAADQLWSLWEGTP